MNRHRLAERRAPEGAHVVHRQHQAGRDNDHAAREDECAADAERSESGPAIGRPIGMQTNEPSAS